jgi:hypothetical protein
MAMSLMYPLQREGRLAVCAHRRWGRGLLLTHVREELINHLTHFRISNAAVNGETGLISFCVPIFF